MTMGLLLVAPKPAPARMKTYNTVFMADMQRVTWQGTHITNNGFCTNIWKGPVLDSIICTPHIITEAEEAKDEKQEQAKPVQKADAR